MRVQRRAAPAREVAQRTVIFRGMQSAVFVDENAAVVIVGADDAALRIAVDQMHGNAGLLAQQLALTTQHVEMRGRIGAEQAAGDVGPS